MRRARRFLLWLTLAGIVVAATGTMGEIMVRLLAPQELSGTWLTYGPRGLVLNKASSTAVHQQGPSVVSYRFNSLHQRGAEPPAAARRVLVLGDSFTFGWMLPEEQTYVGRLQVMADRRFGAGGFQFLNAGTGGWGAGDYLAYLELLGARVAPQLVVIFVSYDDFQRALRHPLYVLEDNTLVERDLSRPSFEWKNLLSRSDFYNALLERSHLLQLLRRTAVLYFEAQRRASYPAPAPAPAVTAEVPAAGTPEEPLERLGRALLVRIKAWERANATPVLLVTTGWPTFSYPWLADAARAAALSFVDLSPAVRPAVLADPRRYEMASDGHPTADGAELIATAAWSAVADSLAALR